MKTRIKVCGITNGEDAERALSLGADYLGVIVYPKSPRAVAEENLPEVLAAIPRGKRVLVDVSTATDRLEHLLSFGFDACQIHFDLEISMATLAGWSGLAGPEALWLAPRLGPADRSFPQVIMEFAETILLDAYDPKAYGGTGKSGENWQRFVDCTLMYQHKNWMLAGGLNPDNIRHALEVTEAGMVDVNSGVECTPGRKDAEKLRRFVEEVERHDQEVGRT